MKYGKILVTLTLVAAANSLAAHYMTCSCVFSPDGSKVAYLSNDVYHGGTVGFAIFTVNADGSAKARFDLKGRVWGAPCFSPGGSKIAFINGGDNFPNRNVFLVDVDGTNLKLLTAYGDDPFETKYWPDETTGVIYEGLTFSPDGRKILYCSAEFGWSDIFAVNVDGTGKTRLTAFAEHYESGPVFLPGGEEMLFIVRGSGEEAGIWIMNADGSGKRKLYTGEYVYEVAVSPDGKKLAYAERRGQDYDSQKCIYFVSNLDGSSRFKVATVKQPWFPEPLFSPDGKKVLYSLESPVYVVNADGSGRKNLTPAWDNVFSLAFFARGAKIAFVVMRPSSPYPCNIWTMDADGSNQKLFKATEDTDVSDLVVSPTGDRFLFQSDHRRKTDYGDGEGDYFIVNVNGSGLARLSEYNPPPYDEEEE